MLTQLAQTKTETYEPVCVSHYLFTRTAACNNKMIKKYESGFISARVSPHGIVFIVFIKIEFTNRINFPSARRSKMAVYPEAGNAG